MPFLPNETCKWNTLKLPAASIYTYLFIVEDDTTHINDKTINLKNEYESKWGIK